MKRCITTLAVVGLAICLTWPASAHEVGLSAATVQLHTNKLEALLTFAVRETEEVVSLDLNQDGAVSADEFALGRETLAQALATNCSVRFDNVVAKLGEVRCQLDTSNNVDLHFTCDLPKFKQLDLYYDVILLLAPGHRMFFTLLTPAGDTIAERLLNQNSPHVSIQLDAETPETKPEPPAALPTFAGFLKLGVEHILVGYDHLLFLLALLVVTRNPLSALKVVTCFTLAHSITLAVATFDLVNLPRTVVEPLVALTIVSVGLENLWRRGDPHGRWLLTFAFGLIHGFGFAAGLLEMKLPTDKLAELLLGFNLGVEVGQVSVVMAVLGVTYLLIKAKLSLPRPPVVDLASAGLVGIGLYWFLGRAYV